MFIIFRFGLIESWCDSDTEVHLYVWSLAWMQHKPRHPNEPKTGRAVLRHDPKKHKMLQHTWFFSEQCWPFGPVYLQLIFVCVTEEFLVPFWFPHIYKLLMSYKLVKIPTYVHANNEHSPSIVLACYASLQKMANQVVMMQPHPYVLYL